MEYDIEQIQETLGKLLMSLQQAEQTGLTQDLYVNIEEYVQSIVHDVENLKGYKKG